jgi:glyoxylase-like metal-dependent hydrolase (beta-lactamase superfamily II)
MIRLLKTIVLGVLLLVVLVVGLLAYTFMARMGPVDGLEVRGARVVVDGFAGLAVVPLPDGRIVLIDAGNDDGAEAILAELRRRRLDADAVAAIFLTHGHPDHIGGVAQFPNAEVMALAAEVPLIEGRVGSRGPLNRLFPVNPTGIAVTRELRDGEVVTLSGASFRVYAVPGHTAGSAAYLANGVLYVGDSADTASDGTLIGAPWVFSDSQAENRASLVRLEQRLVADGTDVAAIVPSHSAVQQGMDQFAAFAGANR